MQHIYFHEEEMHMSLFDLGPCKTVHIRNRSTSFISFSENKSFGFLPTTFVPIISNAHKLYLCDNLWRENVLQSSGNQELLRGAPTSWKTRSREIFVVKFGEKWIQFGRTLLLDDCRDIVKYHKPCRCLIQMLQQKLRTGFCACY